MHNIQLDFYRTINFAFKNQKKRAIYDEFILSLIEMLQVKTPHYIYTIQWALISICNMIEPFNTVSFFTTGTYGDVGGTGPHQFFTDNFTLFQLGSADYAHHKSLSPSTDFTFRWP